jgi:hypothetical protein
MTNAIPTLTIQDWGAVSQVVATLITFVGVLGSLWLSVKALREVQKDRKLRQRPHLAFEPGEHQIAVEFVADGKRIPGVNPAYVEEVFASLPDNAESVRIVHKSRHHEKSFYGHLNNFGLGPALLTHVTWIPKIVWIGSEKFVLDEQKLAEPVYRSELNQMPSCPSHIAPGAEAALSQLPTFIEKDFEKKITQVEGYFHIECEDVFGETLVVKQEFYLFARYKEDPPHVYVLFGDLISGDDEGDA